MKQKLLHYLLLGVLLVTASLTANAQDVVITNCADPAGGCDTIGVEQRKSPWRIGGFLGPGVAFCGTWENTFDPNKYRDRALFNGIGYNAAFNADYYFNHTSPSRVKFGLGVIAGVQNFYLRRDINPFLEGLIDRSGAGDAVVRKGSSEDQYLVAGPVMTFAFTPRPRSSYLEASVRGGVFRTTPAAILVWDADNGNNIYSVTATDRRYHFGLLATLGFFIPSRNGLWAWGIEAMGFRTRLDYVFPGATIYPYTRQHGGFSVGLGVRRNFRRDVPVKKEPTPPLVCEAPDIQLLMDDQPMRGMVYNTLRDSTPVESVVLSWRSRSIPDTATTETFTARIHQLSNGMDNVIAQVICTTDSSLVWPAAYLGPNGRPLEGQYYVTVQSNRISDCASCVSEASATGFSVVAPIIQTVTITPCFKQCYLEVYAYRRVRRGNRIKYGKSSTACENCICPVDTVPRYVSVYHLLGTVKRDSCDAANLDLNAEIENANIQIPSWARTVYVAVESTVVGNCDEPQGINKVNYQGTRNKRQTIRIQTCTADPGPATPEPATTDPATKVRE